MPHGLLLDREATYRHDKKLVRRLRYALRGGSTVVCSKAWSWENGSMITTI